VSYATTNLSTASIADCDRLAVILAHINIVSVKRFHLPATICGTKASSSLRCSSIGALMMAFSR
jgi:hypothetical protein